MASSAVTPVSSLPVARTAGILVAAVAAAVAVNAVIAAIAVALGVPSTYGPITAPAYASMTVLGIAAGWVGWRFISRRATDPRRALTIAVPIVLVASFAPDLLLAVFRFIPGTTVGAVLALGLMHVATAAIAVPAYVLATRSR